MDGTLDYKINTIGDGLASIEILNDEGKVVADGKGENGTLHVEDHHLWTVSYKHLDVYKRQGYTRGG